MAIDTEAARLLLANARGGVCMSETATLGRQRYHPSNLESKRLLLEFGFDPTRYPKLLEGEPDDRFAEAFFEVLGVRRLETIDASNFEGATLVHDMNLPIPSELHGRFDLVYDGGTLEHVFNFQTAVRNCMEMVKVGGRFITHTPANNYFGHGFYQFSPELFYRIFSESNGFVVERMIAQEYGPRRRWFAVADPLVIRERTPLINVFPVLLFVQAKKTRVTELFRECPQQSDYSALWAEQEPKSNGSRSISIRGRFMRWLVGVAPSSARIIDSLRYSAISPSLSFRNRRAFEAVSKRTL